MTLNPIAAIEKLINEHGSAAILRERLSLASDQYSALEGKVTELQTKTEQLEAQNEELRCRVEQNVAENQRLRNQLNENTAHDSKLSPDELNVLQAVAREPGHNHCGIAQGFRIADEVALFLLEELRRRRLVERRGFAAHRHEWHPTQEGRRLLITRALLQ